MSVKVDVALMKPTYQRQLDMPMMISNELHNNLHFFNQGNFNNYSHFLSDELREQSSFHAPKNQSISDSKKSPLLTPGRKSASPSFFHANDILGSAHTIHRDQLKNGQLAAAVQGKISQPFFSESPINLKIATTPTRSKSLSPSLRQVIQPPRIRHKQNDVNTSYSKISSRNSSFDKPHVDTSNKNHKNTSGPVKASSKKLKNCDHTVNSFESEVFFSKNSAFNKVSHKKSSDRSSQPSSNSDSVESSTESSQSLIPEYAIPKLQDKKRLIRIKLPSNMRALNLKNFPADTSANSKRRFSISHQRMLKSSQLKSREDNRHVLEQNVQFIVNKKLKALLDECKRDLIQPALKNLNANLEVTDYRENEAVSLFLDLLDKAKQQFVKSDDTATLSEPGARTSSSLEEKMIDSEGKTKLKRKYENMREFTETEERSNERNSSTY